MQLLNNLQYHPTFHSEDRLVNLAWGSECSIGLSKLFVYVWQGPEECFDKVQTIVQDKPAEECSIQPHRSCQHVTKLVPALGKQGIRPGFKETVPQIWIYFDHNLIVTNIF